MYPINFYRTTKSTSTALKPYICPLVWEVLDKSEKSTRKSQLENVQRV